MPRPMRKEFAGARYHVTARGNGRKAVFLNSADYRRFLQQLRDALERDGVVLYAYVLMPNHYHLLVETPRGNLNEFMRRLNTAYALYFRYRHRWPGHVFQGRYGAKLVGGEEYLLRVTRYVHLNPVRTRAMKGKEPETIKKALRGYVWSSGRGYAGWGDPEPWVDYRWMELLHGRSEKENRRRYCGYLESMAVGRDEEMESAMKASRYAVGDEAFRQQTEAEMRKNAGDRAKDADQHWPRERIVSLERLEKAVAKEFGIAQELLCRHGNAAGTVKSVMLELACSLAGLSQRAAGQRYGGISCAAVGQQRGRLRQKLAGDPKSAEAFARVRLVNI